MSGEIQPAVGCSDPIDQIIKTTILQMKICIVLKEKKVKIHAQAVNTDLITSGLSDRKWWLGQTNEKKIFAGLMLWLINDNNYHNWSIMAMQLWLYFFRYYNFLYHIFKPFWLPTGQFIDKGRELLSIIIPKLLQ